LNQPPPDQPVDQEHRAEKAEPMPRSKDDPEAVDSYLAELPDQERETLEALRRPLPKAFVEEIIHARLEEQSQQ
jgi:hypothetical protein